jgi:serine/threonine protein kinase
LTSQGAGTYWYLPPECFLKGKNQRISSKVDIWSLGVVLYQMLFNRKPFFNDYTQEEILTTNSIDDSLVVSFPPKPKIKSVCFFIFFVLLFLLLLRHFLFFFFSSMSPPPPPPSSSSSSSSSCFLIFRPETKDFINLCLHPSLDVRPDIDVLSQHAFMQGKAGSRDPANEMGYKGVRPMLLFLLLFLLLLFIIIIIIIE